MLHGQVGPIFCYDICHRCAIWYKEQFWLYVLSGLGERCYVQHDGYSLECSSMLVLLSQTLSTIVCACIIIKNNKSCTVLSMQQQ